MAINQVFPRRADNIYPAHKAALVLFGLLLLLKAGISLGTIFNGHQAATSADGIPIDTYTSAGARTVLSLFALLGLSNLMSCLMGTAVLVRYRSLIPFMFGLFLLQQLGRQLILQFLPIARTGTPPGSAINLVILAVMIGGLALSLWRRGSPKPVSTVNAPVCRAVAAGASAVAVTVDSPVSGRAIARLGRASRFPRVFPTSRAFAPSIRSRGRISNGFGGRPVCPFY